MIMVVGPIGTGKTSLLNALQQNGQKAVKTQSISYVNGSIDTPGEYVQMPRFYSSLTVTAAEAKIVLVVQDATDTKVSLPPGFISLLIRPVVGVITKIDLPGANREKAKALLKQAGIKEPYFYVSAHTGAGLPELIAYLRERGEKL
ncbi:EutP/PduV family microcompartment system protein [Desulforamulus aquiferis]|uniref:EutP/PduV family microcompartment system protein n=1 Tax=Desulforamulus aquiferis TaxID=1397668 RepID=A0AAW7ZEI0_9FIRM|nr:EutP/PduV family microcompartment system protein [Desulforamulus aquiferis]MDO7787833.1 EutP/PduV family microcompartment system protein [Desulforamulus aquiferis]RYD04033.1 hypothetical protein N752_16720 [Desulforamulus aquiferis]